MAERGVAESGTVERILVPFAGEGCGVAELSWGQRELWGGMVEQRTWFPIGLTTALPPGTTIEEVAARLRYLMGRHQSMRTRLRFAGGWPLQVVAHSGEVPLEVVDAGGSDPERVAGEVERRYRETDYDFTTQWPVRMAVIHDRGRPTHQVSIMCHLVTDGFGAAAMAADLAERDPVTNQPRRPVTGMPPLAQARWQRSPAGQRQNRTSLRYWERLLRTIPARRFPDSRDTCRPRYWQALLDSPAALQGVHAIAHRTGADTATVLLAVFAVALARVTGIEPVVVRVIVSNRFRPGLADVVAPVSQPGLCAIEVGDSTVDEVVSRTSRHTMAVYKHAYYDTFQLNDLIERVGQERGEEIDIACFFNDRRQPQRREAPDQPPTPQQLRDALPRTTFRWGGKQDRPTARFFVHIEDVPDTLAVSMWADTHYTAPAGIEAFLRNLEAVAVAAAFDPRASTREGRAR